ncbi:MAG: NAD(P)H-dependent oxidoreductase [Lutibacter sp.]|uniref:NAD(P)H-dependent oxidoreductase n=1 Tax=Lutibacter sp. TaxID=1925666 RepID=UPI0017C006F3|nr:NAD(P)H-dependent oxidoreductase [Lutibacter sp.]MBT8316326.1 NAD(P)H-dependent oxidoreductase [Lutibacter sp.]NNJ57186.1 NAD(P)H-dependent oxidoreductase [Lutibacter sp.]
MNTIESLEWRYATKKFDPSKKLSKQQVETLKKAFNLTPTSFGLQPMKMIVISDKQLQEQFVEHSYFQRQVADASHLLVLCIDTDTTTKDINAYFDLEKEIRNVGEKVVADFRKQLIGMYEGQTLEEKQLSAIYQTYIALGNLMTVCAIEKIDACPLEGFVPKKIDELLNLKSLNLKSVLLLPVGFRAEDDIMNGLKKVRKPMNETIIEIVK